MGEEDTRYRGVDGLPFEEILGCGHNGFKMRQSERLWVVTKVHKIMKLLWGKYIVNNNQRFHSYKITTRGH